MILYNYRYRGPYEYDKFINNIFQFYNETRLLEKKLFRGAYSDLRDMSEDLEDILKSLTGENCTLQRLLLIEQQTSL